MTVRPRVLVCGWSGAGNIGDELLTEVVVGRLRSMGADPIVRSASAEATATLHGEIEVVGKIASLRAALAVDAVIVGPGGIIQDHTSLWSLPGHLAPALVARLRRRPVAGIGLGADPLRRRFSRFLLRRALQGAPVVVRDDESLAAMLAAGVAAEIDIDLAWELPSDAAVERSGLVVAIGPVAGEGSLRPGRQRLEDDDPEPVLDALRRLAEGVDGAIRFVAFRGERDQRYATLLAGRLDDAEVVDAPDAVAAIRSAELVVTSRYHAALLAVAAGVPVVADIRQGKLAALVRTSDLEGRIVGFDTWTTAGDAVPAPSTGVRRANTGETDQAIGLLLDRCRRSAG